MWDRLGDALFVQKQFSCHLGRRVNRLPSRKDNVQPKSWSTKISPTPRFNHMRQLHSRHVFNNDMIFKFSIRSMASLSADPAQIPTQHTVSRVWREKNIDYVGFSLKYEGMRHDNFLGLAIHFLMFDQRHHHCFRLHVCNALVSIGQYNFCCAFRYHGLTLGASHSERHRFTTAVFSY